MVIRMLLVAMKTIFGLFDYPTTKQFWWDYSFMRLVLAIPGNIE